MSKVVNATLFPTTLGGTETKELAVVTATSPVDKLATKPTLHLRRFDNGSLYSLTSLKDFMVNYPQEVKKVQVSVLPVMLIIFPR